ncbi:hypothetical protein BDZ97DRAFT_1364276 [Flammula alnicola]|nr:hypothetical protein BDZ97DRAFT_1364276 [Flammula alnicola]
MPTPLSSSPSALPFPCFMNLPSFLLESGTPSWRYFTFHDPISCILLYLTLYSAVGLIKLLSYQRFFRRPRFYKLFISPSWAGGSCGVFVSFLSYLYCTNLPAYHLPSSAIVVCISVHLHCTFI